MIRQVFAAAALMGSLALAGCGYKHESFRYRLTVEVETPQGLRTGSSVIEVDVTQTGDDAWATPEARGVRYQVRGEAVAVEMPDGQVLFALLERAAGLPYAALDPPRYTGEFNVINKTLALERAGRVGEVPREVYPMLATFGDLDDPTSVREVDPDNLAATFGEGVSLRRITVEITDDPVTTGIEQRLGWLSEYPEPRLDPNYRGSTNPNFAQKLWHGDFRQGAKQ